LESSVTNITVKSFTLADVTFRFPTGETTFGITMTASGNSRIQNLMIDSLGDNVVLLYKNKQKKQNVQLF